jgi:pantothenate kinase-related protein Tda10
VDGPEFDAHNVDWNSLLSRMAFYRSEELEAVERWRSSHECKLAGAVAKGVE